MFFINHFNILFFLSLMFHIVLSVFGPNFGLHFVNFIISFFSLFFFLHLFLQKFPHFPLLLSLSFSSGLVVGIFPGILVQNMSHHFLVLFSNYLFLILNNRVCKSTHNFLYFFFSVLFLQISLLFHFLQKSCVFLLQFYVIFFLFS